MSRRNTAWPVGVLSQRFVTQVDVDGAGQRIGDNQRRAGQVVGLHQRIDASLEVAVATEHGRGHQIALRDGLRDRVRQRSAVADAGRAAVADGVETELLERAAVTPALAR